MLDWFRRKRESAPLTGAPEVRRLKTYSAASGYVYQYFYQGQRPAAGGIEYVFSASADRANFRDVSVLVEARAVEGWEQEHERELARTEQYAIAKMALFHAFDEREKPADMADSVHVRYADIEALGETLGLE